MKLSSEKRVERGLAALLVVLLIGLMLSIYYFMQKATHFVIAEKTYQYTHDQKLSLPADLQYKLEADSKLKLIVNSTEVTPDESPLYFEDSQGVILLHDMILVDSNTAFQSATYAMSEIRYEENQNRLITAESREVLQDKFLFDGNHLYFFLEEVVLDLDNEKITLSAYSFVEVIPNESVRIYQHASDEIQLLTSFRNNIHVYDLSNTYSIDLVNDSLKASEGQEILLFTSPSMLKSSK